MRQNIELEMEAKRGGRILVFGVRCILCFNPFHMLVGWLVSGKNSYNPIGLAWYFKPGFKYRFVSVGRSETSCYDSFITHEKL